MKNLSLSLKISVVFTIVSVVTMAFLYFVFYSLFDNHIMKVENEKAILIAKTVEPEIAMNHYLGLDEEVKRIAEFVVTNKDILGLSITLNGKLASIKTYDELKKHIHVVYPVKDPVTGDANGHIDLSYSLSSYDTAINAMRSRIFNYLAGIAVLFIIFALTVRYLLSPFSQIARKISEFSLNDHVDFSGIRVEKETSEIVNAFTRMMGNVREHTVLLERYKHSMDESSIVTKIDVNGLITYVNHEFSRVSGYSNDEVIGSSMTNVLHPDFDSSICETAWNTINDKQIWKGSVKNSRKDGRAYYVRTTIVPILDEDDNVIEFISIQNDITQLIEQKEQILRQTTDPVTGIPNRIKMEEDLKSISHPRLALININNYSIVRDYYGYEVGNRVLIEIAALLVDFLHDKDVEVYKLAAGEYALLADSRIDLNFFVLMCKHLVQTIDDHEIVLDEATFNPHASCGVASDQQKHLSYASLALQHAQAHSKSVIIYEETDNLVQQYEDNITWTSKIRDALSDDRIVVYVQPIFNATSNKIEKYECLVRLIEEDGKVISPFFFLDIAKKSKLYGQITRRVITSSFEIFSKIPDIEFTINLSVEDLVDVETTSFIKKKIKHYAIADRLVFEIVESEGFDSFTEARQFISDVKKLGCKVAIDDFGTGYSNFAYLLELDVDIIKIDGSLIKTIDHDRNSQIITSTILDFSRQLNMATVAEFVHSEAVQNYVTELGIDYLQGFHLGEPAPIESLQDIKLLSYKSASSS